jgi:lactoylglutathione lyase
MKIEHLALWTHDLERLRSFYLVHFNCSSGAKYTNPTTGFSSYFLTFPEGGARLELMTQPGLAPNTPDNPTRGYAHFALSLGTEEHVRSTTAALHKNGVPVWSKPRKTGDGYYESVISDPDGNRIELTV